MASSNKTKKTGKKSTAAAHWVLGDIHGCWKTLQNLLEELALDPSRDRLWLVGDLVNRGPNSLEVLRWARKTAELFGDRFGCVLGNHDLHLVRFYHGIVAPRAKDSLDDVLNASDAEELIDWLVRLPLMIREGRRVMVHAGLDPRHTLEESERRARRVEERLRRPGGVAELLGEQEPDDPELRDLREDLGVFTRIRTCTKQGELGKFSGAPDAAPEGYLPWFQIPKHQARGGEVYFGHWAALGLHEEPFGSKGRVFGLDSGCAWGGRLTALRLDDDRIVQREVLDALQERFPG